MGLMSIISVYIELLLMEKEKEDSFVVIEIAPSPPSEDYIWLDPPQQKQIISSQKTEVDTIVRRPRHPFPSPPYPSSSPIPPEAAHLGIHWPSFTLPTPTMKCPCPSVVVSCLSRCLKISDSSHS